MFKNRIKNVIDKGTLLGVCFVTIITVIACMAGNIKAVKTSSSTISNKKIGWGIKREDNHKQPDVGKVNRELIKKYNGLCMGDENEKKICITFDEGYEAGYTSQILDVLKENKVKATFFITAHYANTASDLVKRMIDEGHIIGNHTVNHKSMPDLSDKELKEEVMKLHQSIYEKFKYEMKYIRPPKGEFSERTLLLCNNLGYTSVMWSFGYVDWDENKQPNENEAWKMIINNLHNGEIMLLHGNSKTNAYILDSIIKEIINQGYEIVNLDKIKE